MKKYLPLFKEVEERLFRAIATRFQLDYPMPDEVAFFDSVSLYRESRDFMNTGAVIPPPEGYEIPEERIEPWNYVKSCFLFLDKCRELSLS